MDLAYKKIRGLESLLVLTLCIPGCGFMTPRQQYPGNQRAPNEIAIVKGNIGPIFGDQYHSRIISFKPSGSPESARKNFGIPGFTDYAEEIHLLPGEYDIQVYCFSGFTSFRPNMKLEITPGKKYKLIYSISNDVATVTAIAE